MADQAQPEPAAPQIQARIRASFERQGLMRHLGARLGDIEPGRVQILLPSRPEVTQQDDYVHAGATSAIADSAGGYAAFTLFPENTVVLTVEYKINLLAPAVGDHLEAIGTVLKSGRTLTICQREVSAAQGLPSVPLWADVSVLAAACHLPAIATGQIPAALGVIDELRLCCYVVHRLASNCPIASSVSIGCRPSRLRSGRRFVVQTGVPG